MPSGPHVLGHFKDLLLAIAQPPGDALLPGQLAVDFKLTPSISDLLRRRWKRSPRQLSQQSHGLNENYGTRSDGTAYAGSERRLYARRRDRGCALLYRLDHHDSPPPTLNSYLPPSCTTWARRRCSGHRIPAGGGESDGLAVIDILAHHPATARFISKQLAQRFVADEPPQSLIDRMAQTFTKSDGDLRAVMHTMFSSPEFFSAGALEAKINSPFEMAVSAVRALRADMVDSRPGAKIADRASRCTAKERQDIRLWATALAEHVQSVRPHQFRNGARVRADSGHQAR